MLPLISAILPLLGNVLDRVLPDQQARDRAKADLASAIIGSSVELDRAAADVVRAEAEGDSWLQRNWRPLTMLTFVGLIVSKWLGFSAPGITEAVELAVFEIIKIGLGGYVLGRSVEKGVKAWKESNG